MFCDCRGRGEIVDPLGEDGVIESLPVFLIKPAFEIPASWAYRQYAASSEYEGYVYRARPCPWGEMVNDLERPVFEKFPVLGDMKSWLLAQPEVTAALLSGSGSTMLAFEHNMLARAILAVLNPDGNSAALKDRAMARYGENCWTFSGKTV